MSTFTPVCLIIRAVSTIYMPQDFPLLIFDQGIFRDLKSTILRSVCSRYTRPEYEVYQWPSHVPMNHEACLDDFLTCHSSGILTRCTCSLAPSYHDTYRLALEKVTELIHQLEVCIPKAPHIFFQVTQLILFTYSIRLELRLMLWSKSFAFAAFSSYIDLLDCFQQIKAFKLLLAFFGDIQFAV